MDAGFALTVTTPNGGNMVIRGLDSATRLSHVWSVVEAHFALTRMSAVLCYGDRHFSDDDEESSMQQLGIHDGDILICVKQPREAWLWNPALLRMIGAGVNLEFEARVCDQAVAALPSMQYRSQAFAEEAAVARDATRDSAEALEESLAHQRGDYQEGAHIWDIYESRRYSLEFASKAAEERAARSVRLNKPSDTCEDAVATLRNMGISTENKTSSPLDSDDEDNAFRCIVLDMGGFHCKAGFAGDDAPRQVIRTIIVTARVGGSYDDALVGELAHLALEQGIAANFIYPIEHGIVTDWEAMEKIWRDIFCNLVRVPLEDKALLLTEAPLNPKSNRCAMLKLAFETFGFQAVHVTVKAILALYVGGRTTGLVAHCGDCATYAVPVYEGYLILHAVLRNDISGRSVTEALQKEIAEADHISSGTLDYNEANDIKEKHCEVQDGIGIRSSQSRSVLYELSDGSSTISLGDELFQCAEVLFQPGGKGFQGLVFKALMKCAPDIRRDMQRNIKLSGGTTLLRGFVQRLNNELERLFPGQRANLIAPPERKYLAWIGGSALGSLSKTSFLSREDYDDLGSANDPMLFL